MGEQYCRWRLRPGLLQYQSMKNYYNCLQAAASRSLTIPVYEELLQLSSGLIHVRDQRTGLYPFQVAALPRRPLPQLKYEAITEQWRERESRLQLDSIYFLLKQAPELLQNCVSGTVKSN